MGVIQLRIKELLEDRGQTLYWLAEQTGVKYPGLWKIVHKKTAGVRFRTLDSICEVLKCKLSELLVRDEDEDVRPKADAARRRKARRPR